MMIFTANSIKALIFVFRINKLNAIASLIRITAKVQKTKEITLSSREFLRRFCLHILPKDFRKIRRFGILASRNKSRLTTVQKEMDIPARYPPKPVCLQTSL